MAVAPQLPPLVRPTWTADGLSALALRYLARVSEVALARVPDVLRDLLRSLSTGLGIDRASLYLITADRHGFFVVCSWADDEVPPVPQREFRAVSSRLVERTLEGKVTRLERIEDSLDHTSADYAAMQRVHQKSLLLIPLRASGGTVGALSLGGVRNYYRWPDSLLRDLSPVLNVIATTQHRCLLRRYLDHAREEHAETQRIAGVGHWRHDFVSRSTTASVELLRALHLDQRAEFEVQQMVGRVHPDDRELFQRHVSALMFGSSLDPIECRVVRRGAPMRWYRCWGEVRTDAEGLPVLAHGVFHDITERRRTQDDLELTTRRLVQAQEDERARLGRDLHDDLGQRVTALSLHLASTAKKARPVSEGVADALVEAQQELSEVGLIVRDLSHSLHPADLRRGGLVASLVSLARRCSMLAEVDIIYDGDELEVVGPLSEDAELALFRVVQESVSNALRHANARRIEVSAGCRLGMVQVAVLDDGDGFDASDSEAERGLGLLGMEERMRQVGGMLSIASQPGHGTEVVAEVQTLNDAEHAEIEADISPGR